MKVVAIFGATQEHRIIQELILFPCLDLTALEFSFHDVSFSLAEPTEIYNAQRPNSTKGKLLQSAIL